MKLYAKITRSDDSPGTCVVQKAWTNNASRFFHALTRVYGQYQGPYVECDRHGGFIVTGWRFERRIARGLGMGQLVTTVRLLTPCPVDHPDAVTLDRMKVPYQPFILRKALPRFVSEKRAA